MKLTFSYSCVLAALFFSLTMTAQPQSPQWCVPPFIVDFTGASPVATALPGWTSGPEQAANAAFSNTGDLLFFVAGQQIFDATGSPVATISGNFVDPRETAVFKVPGFCNRYYVISVLSPPFGNASLFYTMVDASSTGVTVVSGQHNINFTGAGSFFEFAEMAVSRLRIDGTRFLYFSGGGNMGKYIVTSTGITFSNAILGSSSGLSFRARELDLNHAGNKIAWGVDGFGANAVVNVVSLDGNGNFVSVETYTIPNGGGEAKGVEFNATGTSIFVASIGSTNEGINRIDLTLPPTSFFHIPSSATYGFSQLEMAFDGKIYASNGFNLGCVDPATNILTSNAVSIGVDFTLPDQVDGQDYLQQSGQPDFWVSDGMDQWSTVPDDGTEPRPNMSWDGDIWNCENNPNCMQGENPEFKLSGDNFMRVRVRNNGCSNSLPTTADLHMYWTRGRSGEIWDGHWLDPILRPLNIITGNAAGGEITANQLTAVTIPIDIPAIPVGGEVILTKSWRPPNPSDFALDGFDEDADHNPMVCFLARVESAIDPMFDEQYGAIADNVRKNNNIATRNTYLVDLDPFNIHQWGGTIGVNLQHDEAATVRLDFDAAPMGEHFSDFGTVTLQLSAGLWNLWMESGARSENVEIVDDENRIVKLLDAQHASLQGLGLALDQEYSIRPGFQLNEGAAQGAHNFQFRINMVDENTGEYGSANTYEVSVSEECRINLQNEWLTTPGHCVTIGENTGCNSCTYQWTPADGLAEPDSPVTSACPSETTTYRLLVINEATGCVVSEDVTVYVQDEVGNRTSDKTIAESVFSDIKLFPNPASELLHVKLNTKETASIPMVLINSLGQIVIRNVLLAAKGENTYSIDIKQVPQGVYFLHIGEGGQKPETITIVR